MLLLGEVSKGVKRGLGSSGCEIEGIGWCCRAGTNCKRLLITPIMKIGSSKIRPRLLPCLSNPLEIQEKQRRRRFYASLRLAMEHCSAIIIIESESSQAILSQILLSSFLSLPFAFCSILSHDRFGIIFRNKTYETAASSIDAEALTNCTFFSSLFPTK